MRSRVSDAMCVTLPNFALPAGRFTATLGRCTGWTVQSRVRASRSDEVKDISVGPAAQAQTQRATPKDWLGLVVLAFAVLLIAVDGTVLDLALPFISSDLSPSSNQLLLIIDVYSFVLAGLLITMGT